MDHEAAMQLNSFASEVKRLKILYLIDFNYPSFNKFQLSIIQ